jgi:protoheme IX farnesyltransferase
MAVIETTLRDEDARGAGIGTSGWRDYLDLMKPRVMSLVVFTGVAGLVASPVELHPLLAAIVILAIAAGAGAAGALNMWFDADIDAGMRRTRTRPIPAGRVARSEALSLGLIVSALSVILLLLAGGILAAVLLAFTIVFYALIYTMWLKRSNDQNIVIGGLAGALPPAIAWAATGAPMTLEPWVLVAIIFVWTPPHFWALCLYQATDYARVGVPMLPNTAGPGAARQQILLYSLALVPLGVTPALLGTGGVAYAAVSVLGGALFLLLVVRVWRSRAGDVPDGDGSIYDAAGAARPARDLFAYSILYLALLFAALIAEHAFGLHVPLGWSV